MIDARAFPFFPIELLRALRPIRSFDIAGPVAVVKTTPDSL